jgi:hypothetical protein
VRVVGVANNTAPAEQSAPVSAKKERLEEIGAKA